MYRYCPIKQAATVHRSRLFVTSCLSLNVSKLPSGALPSLQCTVIHHGVGNDGEACHVSTFFVVDKTIILLTILNACVMDVGHDLLELLVKRVKGVVLAQRVL